MPGFEMLFGARRSRRFTVRKGETRTNVCALLARACVEAA